MTANIPYKYKAQAELERRKRLREREEQSRDWRAWIDLHFASYTTAPFAPRHVRFWEWIESLQPGVRPRARVEVWPRGGAKSTTIELGCARLGSERTPRRHYGLYVCKTQAQADKHVQSIASMLEHVGVGRAINEYGSSKGWRHSEVRTSTGFNVTAFGLDSGLRGVKIDEFRPDLIIFDDIDDRQDTKDATSKKIALVTTSILPSGASDCATIFVQNKIAQDSIISQLCDGRADFLHDRLPPTVEPAVQGLDYKLVPTKDGAHYIITGGVPTWEGQDLAICEQQINDWGLRAFLREAQHDIGDTEGALWTRAILDAYRVSRAPQPVRTVVGVDPSVTAGGDEAGIVVASIDSGKHAYVLDDLSVQGSPDAWARQAVVAYHRHKADRIIAEANQGGEMVTLTIKSVDARVPVQLVHASRGKQARAEPIAALYEQGKVHHVGAFAQLEDEMCSWTPGGPSPNRIDACVWALSSLTQVGTPSVRLI